MKKEYWECESCGKKAHDSFPKNWLHAKSLVIGLGLYSENRVHLFTPEEQKKFLRRWNTTFCSIECFVKWIAKEFKVNLKLTNLVNPSERRR